jgi:hypothetical protein
MNKLKLFIKPESISVLPSGKLTGIFHFIFQRDYFPEENWNDFPVIFVSWINSLKKLESKKSREENLRFLDGPFYLNITRVDDYFLLKFVDNERIIHRLDLSLEEFMDLRISISEIIKFLVVFTRDNDIYSVDLAELRRACR